MSKIGMDIFRKHFWLIGVGVVLQMLSGIFFFAGAIGTLRDVNARVRELLMQKMAEEE